VFQNCSFERSLRCLVSLCHLLRPDHTVPPTYETVAALGQRREDSKLTNRVAEPNVTPRRGDLRSLWLNQSLDLTEAATINSLTWSTN
jgi:hypothetical protein